MKEYRQLTIQNNFTTTLQFPLRGFFNVQIDMEPHRQEFVELVFILHRKAEHFTAPEGWQLIHRGDVWIIPANGIHGFRETGGKLQLFNLLFVPDKLPAPLLDLYTHSGYRKLFFQQGGGSNEISPYPHLRLTAKQMKEMETMLNLFVGFADNHAGKYGIFMAILTRLCDLAATGITEPEQRLDMQKLQHFFSENYASEISIHDLCRMTAMSPNTLRHHFHKAFGTTPMEYLCRLRLAAACRLLLNSTLSVKETAHLTGFKDESYFVRIFRKNYHCPPGMYRRQEMQK